MWEIIAGLVGAAAGSSVLTVLVQNIFQKRKNKADIYELYTTRLEKRMDKMERRQDRFDMRDDILTSAISCSYRCSHSDECPVLDYLSRNPLPEKTDDTAHNEELA